MAYNPDLVKRFAMSLEQMSVADERTGANLSIEQIGARLGLDSSESFRIAHSNRPPAEMFAGPNVLEIHEVILSTERRE